MSTSHSPSALGAEARAHFDLRPELTQLNHGSFGALPTAIRLAQDAIRLAVERDPIAAMATVRHEGALRRVIDGVASRVGTTGDRLAFVENATTAVSTVLRGVALRAGDRVVTTNLGYGAVERALEFIVARAGATLDVVTIPFPVSGPDEVLELLKPRLEGATVAVLDWITSATALVLPIVELARVCRESGVKLLVDAAHVPGHLPMDLDALDADWVVGNLHKWGFAPKGTAILWAREGGDRLLPLSISHGVAHGFPRAFDWIGSRDYSGWLVAADAMAFADRWPTLMADRRRLCTAMAERIAERWGTTLPAPPTMRACLATIPLPGALASVEPATLWRRARAANMEVAFVVHEGQTWARISAAAYNHPDEYERFAGLVMEWVK